MKKLILIPKPKLSSRVTLVSAYIVPFLALVIFVNAHSVNVPWLDQWELPELFYKVVSGKASFQIFFAQHNEHRLVFPKLIFTILAFLTHWNTVAEMYLSIFISALSFFLIYRIAAGQTQKQDFRFWLTNVLTSGLIFSFIQAENWLWGFQVAWFLVNLCLVICIFFFSLEKFPVYFRLCFAAISCFVASFSSAHGLIVWIAVIPSLVTSVHQCNSFRRKAGILTTWMILFSICCLVYFSDYSKPSHHPSLFYFFENLDVGATYFFSILGSPLIYKSNISTVLGLFVFINFSVFLVCYLRRPASNFSHNLAPWISLGLFSIIFALMTTIGRAGLGADQALSSRYTTVSVLLIIALIQMWKIFSKAISRIRKLSIIVLSICAFLTVTSSIEVSLSFDSASTYAWNSDRKWLQPCLEISQSFDHGLDSCLQGLYPNTKFLKSRVQLLNKIGFGHDSVDIEKFTFGKDPDLTYGHLDSPISSERISLIKKDCLNCTSEIKFTGWAILPNEQRSASLVLFSYRAVEPITQEIFLGTASVSLPSPDVAKVLKSSQYSHARWSSTITVKQLPLGETVVKSWVYDSKNKSFVMLGLIKVRVEK